MCTRASSHARQTKPGVPGMAGAAGTKARARARAVWVVWLGPLAAAQVMVPLPTAMKPATHEVTAQLRTVELIAQPEVLARSVRFAEAATGSESQAAKPSRANE